MLNIIGITGGIGSGKSLVCRILEAQGIPVFYTDDEAKSEMRQNTRIHQALAALIGPHAISPDGRPVKAVIADYICHSQQCADQVNAIVHPCVRQRMLNWIAQTSSALHLHHNQKDIPCNQNKVLAVESALLFESGFHKDCTYTACIIAPLPLRIQRIMQRDGITHDNAMQWIERQMPQEQKAARADITILNDGITPLTPQISNMLSLLPNVHH